MDQPERPRANVWRIVELLEPLAGQLRSRLSADAGEADLSLYEDASMDYACSALRIVAM